MNHVFNYEKRRNLSRLFIEYIVSVWKSNGSKNMSTYGLVNKTMEDAFQMAHNNLGGLHKPEYYVYWVCFVNIIIKQ